MSINTWPIDERPREKLLAKGVGSLSDAELLAILLRTGSSGTSAVALARKLLEHFSGLDNLLGASRQELCGQFGVGISKYCQIVAALELAKRQLQVRLQDRDIMANTDTTKHFLQVQLQHRKQEIFGCLFLDNGNHVICFEELFFGTINSAAVYPREIVRKALSYNAAAIILVHNHPSGTSEPSRADIQLTAQLCKITELVDVRILDHIVVGKGRVTSFVEEKLLY